MRRRKNKGGGAENEDKLEGWESEGHSSFPGEGGRDSFPICVQFYGFSKAMACT